MQFIIFKCSDIVVGYDGFFRMMESEGEVVWGEGV